MPAENQNWAKPLTPGELADMYGVSAKTLRTWLVKHEQKIGQRVAKYFTTRQVKMIYKCIGCPTEPFSE
jgi:uncharacterized protein YjcR